MRGRIKKILALILAANLAVSPVSVLAEEQTEIAAQGAETEIAAEPAAEAAQEKTASAEAPAEQTPAEAPAEQTPAEVPAEASAEQTPAEIPAEAPAETPAEIPAEAPAETQTEVSAEAPAQTPAETQTETPAEKPAETSTEASTEAAAQKTEQTAAKDGSASAESGEEQQILKIDSLTAQYAGDMVVITIVTKNKDYNKLYIGKREDKKKKPVIEGKENKEGTYTFKFKVKPEKLGQKLFFVPREAASDQWYVEEELFIRLPESAAAESAGADTSSDAAGAAGAEDLSDAGASAETDGETGWDEDWLTEEETEEPNADLAEKAEETDAASAEEADAGSTEERNVDWLSGEEFAQEPDGAPVAEESEEPFAVQAVAEEMQETPAPTPTPEAEITKLQVVKEDGGEFAMFKISDGYSVKEENGELSITFSTENTSYNGIYLGSKNDEVKEPVYKALETEALFTFNFKVPLDRAGSRIPILLQKKSDGSWYTKQDLFLTIPKADGEAEPTPTPTQTPTPTPTPEPTGKVLPDGVYSIPADGAVTGEAMFKVIEATLTSSGGSMTAKIVLSGSGYDYLYMGTAKEALAADESKWIKYSKELKDYYSDADGKTQDRRMYEIPVAAMDVPIPVASHSAKKGTWTDHTITFISDKAVLTGEAPTPTPGENPSPTPEASPTPTPGTSPTPTPGENPTPTPGEDVGGTTDPVDNSTALADGSYAPQNFTFEGGTGKTAISCTEITVKDGKAFATIVFSSDKFQYVKANGEIFENPVVENGTAAFTIPVVLNQKNRILAMTMAMGTPHEVEYYITADYEQQASDVPADGIYQAETKVDSTSGMFRVIDSRLTVKDGEMTAVILLSGSGYDYLYLGTKEEAAAAKKSEWIPVKKTYSNYYSDYDKKTQDRCSYEIPVSALDTPIALAARSKEKKEWYDRTVTFLSEGLKKTDSAEFPDNTVKPTPTPTPDNSGNSTGGNNSGSGNGSNTGSGNSGTDGSTGNNTGSTGTGSGSNTGSTGSGSGGNSAGSLNGSTGATGSTTLADGEYTPDSFSFSGGTGKTTITCAKITVKNGQAYATIVFDSDKYQYVKAGGTKVTGSQGGGTSTFEIPVTLNANNTIYAMTTAMSQPHEIQYTLYIGLNAAKGTTTAGGGSSDGAVAAEAEEEEGGQTKPLGTISEDKDAPEIAGLTYEGSLDRDYAENFKIHYYENDFIVLEIDVANNTGRTDLDEDGNVIPEETELTGEPETTGESGDSANEAAGTFAEEDGSASETEDKSFYRETTVKYLLVPEDAEIPAGIDKEMMILHRPVKKAYVDSSNALNILDRMDAVESIAAVGFRQEECKLDSVAGAMERGDILFAGSFEAPQFRDLVTAECDLAIVPEEILPEAAADEAQAETLSADDEAQAETLSADGEEEAEETAGQDGDTSAQDDKAQAGDASQAETAAEMQDDMRAEAVAEQTKKMQELGDRFALLDIPMIIDRSSAEEEKLGQYEWCKVYGLLFGSEETAVKLYENAVKAMATWETRERPTMQKVELNESAESASDETQGE